MSCSDVRSAISISHLKSHKNNASGKLSTDLFVNAGVGLSVHIGLLFSAITSHGTVPTDFGTSTILPIPKIKSVSAVVILSQWLCSYDDSTVNIVVIIIIIVVVVVVKLFENIVMHKYADNYIHLNYSLASKRTALPICVLLWC